MSLHPLAGERGMFLKGPYLADVDHVDDAEVAVVVAPLDAGVIDRCGEQPGPGWCRRVASRCARGPRHD